MSQLHSTFLHKFFNHSCASILGLSSDYDDDDENMLRWLNHSDNVTIALGASAITME